MAINQLLPITQAPDTAKQALHIDIRYIIPVGCARTFTPQQGISNVIHARVHYINRGILHKWVSTKEQK